MIPSLAEHRSISRWNKWIGAGIWTVGQICHQTEDRLLGQQELQNKFPIEPTFLEALAIRNYIPIQWKQSISRDYKGEDTVYYGMVINEQEFNLMSSGPKVGSLRDVRHSRDNSSIFLARVLVSF